MASADELRAQIEASRQALKEAIEAAAAKWEQAMGEEWSPRKIAEHAIGAERAFAGMIARAMQSNPPDRKALELPSSDAALTELDAAAGDFTKVARYVEDRDLAKPAEVFAPYPNTVEGAIQASNDHLAGHAEQIREASK